MALWPIRHTRRIIKYIQYERQCARRADGTEVNMTVQDLKGHGRDAAVLGEQLNRMLHGE
jgi:hypothetical protein